MNDIVPLSQQREIAIGENGEILGMKRKFKIDQSPRIYGGKAQVNIVYQNAPGDPHVSSMQINSVSDLLGMVLDSIPEGVNKLETLQFMVIEYARQKNRFDKDAAQYLGISRRVMSYWMKSFRGDESDLDGEIRALLETKTPFTEVKEK